MMPSLLVADWMWLQPYGEGKFMALNVGGKSEENRERDSERDGSTWLSKGICR